MIRNELAVPLCRLVVVKRNCPTLHCRPLHESNQSQRDAAPSAAPPANCTNKWLIQHRLQRHLRQQRNDLLANQRMVRCALDHHRQLHRRLRHLHRRLSAFILRAIHDIRPVDQVPQRRPRSQSPSAQRSPINPVHTCIRIEKLTHNFRPIRLPPLKVLPVCLRHKRALMMIEPPHHLRRSRILEIHNRIFTIAEIKSSNNPPARCTNPWYENVSAVFTHALVKPGKQRQ